MNIFIIQFDRLG